MSRYKRADEMKDTVIFIIRDSLGQDSIEEKRYGHQKLYIVKDRLRLYVKDAISDAYGLYFFGLSKTAISVFKENQEQNRYKDYFLFLCGNEYIAELNILDNLPQMIYLIPSSFIINDNIKVLPDKRYGQQQIHIVKDPSDRWIIREDKLKRDLSEFCMSLGDLIDFLVNLDTNDKDNESQQREIELLEDFPSLKSEEREVIVKQVKRYHDIVENSKRKYNNKCQIKDCGFTFKKKNGRFYSEAHHLIPLSEGGTQEENNIIILCPNHHRMMHYADIEIGNIELDKREIKINGNTYFIIY
jgi:predicted HNH restriction endonuclease